MHCNDVTKTSPESVKISGVVDINMKREMKFPFTIELDVASANKIGFNITVPDALSDFNNFMELKFASTKDEEIYGMGLQFTVWDFKGWRVPLLTNEGGVGRGLSPITEMKGIDGGSEVTSYAAAASFITNKGKGVIFRNNHLGMADFTSADASRVLYWHATSVEGFLISGESELELAQRASQTIGTMRALPEWLSKGIVVGIVGG